MAEEKRNINIPHNLILQERKTLSLSGVNEVDSFDEGMIIVYTTMGELTIKGNNLHINKLNLESGDLSVEGDISSLTYQNRDQSAKGIISKLFK